MRGFYIKELQVTGQGLRPASLRFNEGANLVTGASNTGKSYAFAAIHYMLGGSEPPKDINEGIGYTDIYLEIYAYKHEKTYTLHRKIGQKYIEVKASSIGNFLTSNSEYKKYTTTGSVAIPEHISFFLLSLSDLENKKLLFNKNKGETRNLSFKVLSKLCFVDEELIIKTSSPYYYSHQYFEQIVAQSLLHLLMTGVDYSDTIEKEDKKTKETRLSGKLEFLSFQITQFALEKDELIEEVNKLPVEWKDTYNALDAELKNNLNEAKEFTKKKNDLILRKQALTDELLYTKELLSRFQILKKQYTTDTERLDFILETDVLSSQLGDVVCPICSSPLQSDHLDHLAEQKEFRIAATQELKKNRSKLSGLNETVSSLQGEKKKIEDSIEKIQSELDDLELQISSNFTPKIQNAQSGLKEYLGFEKLINKIAFIEDRTTKLFEEKARIEKLLNVKEQVEDISILTYSLLASLSEKIEARLKKWNYEDFIKVDFNQHYKVFDIVISGKSRKSYGKGKRSISYAACLIGLLDYCAAESNNFVNLIIMDSPLTTFEEKRKQKVDGKEVVTREVLKSFFQDFVNLPPNTQLIIFDNKEPDETTKTLIADKLNLQVFTGTDEDRNGFFPM